MGALQANEYDFLMFQDKVEKDRHEGLFFKALYNDPEVATRKSELLERLPAARVRCPPLDALHAMTTSVPPEVLTNLRRCLVCHMALQVHCTSANKV